MQIYNWLHIPEVNIATSQSIFVQLKHGCILLKTWSYGWCFALSLKLQNTRNFMEVLRWKKYLCQAHIFVDTAHYSEAKGLKAPFVVLGLLRLVTYIQGPPWNINQFRAHAVPAHCTCGKELMFQVITTIRSTKHLWPLQFTYHCKWIVASPMDPTTVHFLMYTPSVSKQKLHLDINCVTK